MLMRMLLRKRKKVCRQVLGGDSVPHGRISQEKSVIREVSLVQDIEGIALLVIGQVYQLFQRLKVAISI